MKRRFACLAAFLGVLSIGCKELGIEIPELPDLRNLFASGISQEEQEFGDDAIRDVVKDYGGDVADPAIQDYVNKLGWELVDSTGDRYKNAAWEFHLVQASEPFACSVPGGKIVVTQGLARQLRTRVELAAVFGHEMAHVVHQDVWNEVQQDLAEKGGKELIKIIEATFGNGKNPERERIWKIGKETIQDQDGFRVSFKANQEFRADSTGLELIRSEEYAPEGMLRLLLTLQTLHESATPSSSSRSIFYTHPEISERVGRIRAELSGLDPAGRGLDEAAFRAEFLAPLEVLRLSGLGADSPGPVTSWCRTCQHAHSG